MGYERLYRSLPQWAQDVAISAQGYRLKRRRYGRVYRRYKRSLPTIYSLSRHDVTALQLSRLKEFLSYAKERSAFYSRLYEGIDIDSIESVSDLARLPAVDKETLRQHMEEVYTMPARGTYISRTGGTTGKSLVVRRWKNDVQVRMAELDYFRETHGARHGMRRASFSGKIIVPEGRVNTEVFWRTNRALNQRFYSSFHLSYKNAEAYIRNLNEYQPEIIDGFANCIADLCRYAKALGLQFSFRPVAVFPTSEPLLPEHREVIREMLEVEPRDQYASSEGAPFIFECKEGRLHYAMHTGVIETDESGEALVTSFTTHATPLIRYRIGDRIVFSGSMCTCGWDTPIVERIEGRSGDYLISPSGVKIYPANLANAVKVFPNSIIQAQFVQKSIDSVLVRVVVDEHRFDENEGRRIICDEVLKRMGAEVRVDVEVVDEIPKAPSGKMRFVVNECI